MQTAGWEIAEVFSTRYPQSRQRLENWRKHILNAEWKQPVDVWKTFNSASYISIKEVWVFNIGSDRLVASIDFIMGIVLVKHVRTHTVHT